MGWLINLFAGFSGMGWVWTKVDGYKAFIAGSISMLTGLLGLVQEFSAPLLAHNTAGLWALIKGLPSDSAWLMLLGGLGTIGIRHSIAKSKTP